MKSVFIGFILVIFAAGVVFAGSTSGTAPAVGKVNVPLTVPKKANSTCSTLPAGSASTLTISVATTAMVSWQAFVSAYDSTALVIKRFFDSNTAYWRSSEEKNLPIEVNVTNLVFKRFSGSTNPAAVICIEKN